MNYKDWNIIGTAILCGLVVLSAIAVYTYAVADQGLLPTMTIANIGGDLFCMLTCVVIFASTLRDRHLNRSNVLLMCMLTLEALLLFWDLENWMIEGKPELIFVNEISNYFVYILVPVIILTFWLYLRELIPEHRKVMNSLSVWIVEIVVISIAIILSNPWTHIYFSVDHLTGLYERSDTFYVSYFAPIVIAIASVFCILRYVKSLKRKLALLCYTLVPLLAAIVQFMFYGISLQYTSMMMAIILMYANIYNDRSTELIRNEMAMTEQRASAMVSQIQPHFLYNALTSIMNIPGNSWEVKDAIADFGKYLRFNMDSITQRTAIPVSKELEHVEIYTDLRKLKYGDRLNVEYDTKVTNFFIPSQTLKVIVSRIIADNLDNCPDREIHLIIRTFIENRTNVIEIRTINPPDADREFVSDESNGEIESLRERLRTMVFGDVSNTQDEECIITRISVPIMGGRA